MSDVHFNPLDDPALADRLAAAPVDQWDGIFDADPRPVSPYGTDANAPLFRLALLRMRSEAGSPAVVVIPGDLLVHTFRVQWNHAAKDTSDDAFFAFADKTIAYLAREFDATFPAAPFIVTLGNNDSPYGDDHIQPHSPFLAHDERAWEPNGAHVVVVNSNAWSDDARSIDEPALRTADASIDVSGSPFTPITATNRPTFRRANDVLDPTEFAHCTSAP